MRDSIWPAVAVAIFLSFFASVSRAQNPFAGEDTTSSRPFEGSFVGDNILLELKYDGTQQAYTGWLTFKGNRYACGGAVENSQLVGKFVVDRQAYPFSVGINGRDFTLTSAGKNYPLQRQVAPAPAAANPFLDGGGNNPNPPPANTGGMGGVGLRFQPNADGDLEIVGLMPGGPAEQAGIKVGTYLVAVDGTSVEKKGPEQVREMLGGKVGTKVTLSIETEQDSHDYILTRVDLNAGNPQPARPIGPGLAGPGDNPGPTPQNNGMAPGWLKPGVRLTWWSGSASIPGATTVLVPDDNGNWKTPDGRKFSPSDNPGAGGYGYQQITIASVNNNVAVVDARNFLIHPENQACTSVGATGYVLPVTDGGDYWKDPRALAQMQAGGIGAVRVYRGPYQLGNKQYNVVRITTRVDNGWTQQTYDQDSGLMLSMGSSSIGQAQMLPGPNGQGSYGGATTNIMQGFLVGVRQTNIPWVGQRGPRELANLRQIDFTGTYRTEVPQVPSITWGYGIRYDFTKMDEWSFAMRQSNVMDYRNGQQPQPTVSDRAGSLGVFWIDPQILGRLQQGQVIDDDPYTKRRLSVQGIQNGSVIFAEEGPLENSAASYDRQSGLITGMQLVQQVGIGRTTIQVQRTR